MAKAVVETGEQRALKWGPLLPDDRPELLELAMATVREFNAAHLSGDEAAQDHCDLKLDAIVFKLHGNDFFGSRGGKCWHGDHLVEDYCRALPGEIPIWGQSGTFLIEVEGIRSVVEFDGHQRLHEFIAFHTMDPDAPYVSETGFTSRSIRGLCKGQTVDQVAVEIFQGFMAPPKGKVRKPKLKVIQPSSREHCLKFLAEESWVLKRPKVKAPTREQSVAAIAADLPNDRSYLEDVAGFMPVELSDAEIDGDEARIQRVLDIIAAVESKLNPVVATAAEPSRPAWSRPAYRTGDQLQLGLFDDPPAEQPEIDPLPAELEQLHQLVELAWDRNQQACDACEHLPPRLTRLTFLRAALWPRNNPKDRQALVSLYWEHRLRDLRRCPPAQQIERPAV